MSENIPIHLKLQALSPWVSREHWLTPTEIAVEHIVLNAFVAAGRPAPSALMLALVSVLSIPDAVRTS